MVHLIEIKVVGSAEYWFVTKDNYGFHLTRRYRYAHRFDTKADARAALDTLVAYTPEQMRKYLIKDDSFNASLTFNLHGLKTADADPALVSHKLYTFIKQD